MRILEHFQLDYLAVLIIHIELTRIICKPRNAPLVVTPKNPALWQSKKKTSIVHNRIMGVKGNYFHSITTNIPGLFV